MKGRWAPHALAVAASIGAGGLCAGAAVADDLSLNLRNDSIAPVSAIQVSADYRTSWGGNLLTGAISPGQVGRVIITGVNGHCFFDIQVEDANGRQAQYWGRNLCADTVIEHR